jgi:hypothetical protein
MIGKAADDLDHHEDGGDDGRPFGACLGAGMAAAQKDVVTRPDAVVVRACGPIMMMAMIVVMGMPMCVIVKPVPMGMIVRHGDSLAPSGRKSAP